MTAGALSVADALSDLRARRHWSCEDVDARAQLPVGTCRRHEEGAAAFDVAYRLLAGVAVALGVPIAVLISPSGRSSDGDAGGCGALVERERRARGLSPDALASASGAPLAAYLELEAGRCPIETQALELLRIAEALDVALFDLVMPA